MQPNAIRHPSIYTKLLKPMTKTIRILFYWGLKWLRGHYCVTAISCIVYDFRCQKKAKTYHIAKQASRLYNSCMSSNYLTMPRSAQISHCALFANTSEPNTNTICSQFLGYRMKSTEQNSPLNHTRTYRWYTGIYGLLDFPSMLISTCECALVS